MFPKHPFVFSYMFGPLLGYGFFHLENPRPRKDGGAKVLLLSLVGELNQIAWGGWSWGRGAEDRRHGVAP
jgi:hypothetical protein